MLIAASACRVVDTLSLMSDRWQIIVSVRVEPHTYVANIFKPNNVMKPVEAIRAAHNDDVFLPF